MSITPEQDRQEVDNLFHIERHTPAGDIVLYEVSLEVSPDGSARADLFELDSDGSSPSEAAASTYGETMGRALRALGDLVDAWNHVRTA